MLPRQSLAFLVLALLGAALSCEAFQPLVAPTGGTAPRMRLKTERSAWTIMPTAAAPFSNWYNEYNPTARRTVYDDSPLDYNFITLGDDWPSVDSSEHPTETKKQEGPSLKQQRRGPIRRVAEWAGKVRRRS